MTEKTTYYIETMPDDELVELFRVITEQQYYAGQMDRIREYNKLHKDMVHVATELKRRPGDQRSLLTRYFQDRNPQTRLMCAAATLTILSEQARDVLQKLYDSAEYPQAADAGMFVDSFDEGRWPGLPPEENT